MVLPNYQFCDLSHHNGHRPGQALADMGHRLVVRKASDSYHMPDKNNVYDFSLDRHWDSRFVDGVRSDMEAAMVWLGYHFARWDRPIGTKLNIVKKNLEYFLIALKMLVDNGIVTESFFNSMPAAVLDMEQNGKQLTAAGLSKADVSAMAVDIVTLFKERFPNLILYTGSWWTDAWVTKTDMEKIASMCACWEAEYTTIVMSPPYMPVNPLYDVSVPYGFKDIWVTAADDFIGKKIAWQYTSDGKIVGYGNYDTDYNLTQMRKEEWFKFTGLDFTVDPPGGGTDPTEPPTTDCTDAVKAGQVAVLDEIIDLLKGTRDGIINS